METLQVEEAVSEDELALLEEELAQEATAAGLQEPEGSGEVSCPPEEDAVERDDAPVPGKGEGETGEGESHAAGAAVGKEASGLPKSCDIGPKELGARGEDAAAAYLERKGYRVLERNWTCRFGEADIIAADGEGTICFIEVKTRRSVDRGIPEEAITPEKQRRYEKIALSYMMEADWDDCVELRFDAIGICVTGDYSAILRHHLACFNGL